MTEIIGQWKSLAVAPGCWRMMYTQSGCSPAAEVMMLLPGPGTASQKDKPGASPNLFFSFFHKTSGIMDMEIRPGLLIKKDIRETVSTHR